MGMYTTFMFSGTIKPEFEEMIQDIVYRDVSWENFESEYPWLKKFTKLARPDFIPWGVMTEYNKDKFSPSSYCEIKYGVLVFCCDLKNYGREIETFMTEVAPRICERIGFAASWYEEDEYPKIYYPNKEEK